MRPLPDILALTASEAVPMLDDPRIRPEPYMPPKPEEPSGSSTPAA